MSAMSPSPRIEYLRWARAQAEPPHAAYNLILSGMTAPPATTFDMPTPDEMVGFLASDHPPLAHRVAEELRVSPDAVLIQPGTHYSIGLLLNARLRAQPGPVIVESPAYEPLIRIPEAMGATVLRLPRPRAKGYALDLSALESLEEARPSVLLLSHPHNPSGAQLTEEEVQGLAEFSRRSGCAVISDEVYLEFLENPEAASLLHRIPGGVILRSFTKVFGLGGMRCTIVAGDRDWIDAAAVLTDHGPVALPAPSHAFALRVWDQRESLWNRARHTSARGRAIVAEWLVGVADLLEAPLPGAGIICFPELRAELHARVLEGLRRRGGESRFGFGLDGREDSSHRWIADLRREKDVQLVPGAFFETPSAFRLGFGVDEAVLRGGLEEIETYFRRAVEEA